jgi:ribosomal protein S18 acetylase RimI-like enzyme
MPDWLVAPYADDELETIVALVNSAYRGQSAKVGWAHESDYIDGQRTSLADLKADLAGDASLLTLRAQAGGEILACAVIERLDETEGRVGYIGMVTVKPDLQAGGVGRAMLAAAEDHARAFGAARARMTVVSIRDTLIAWYERRGYRDIGERRPFPYGDERFGRPRVEGLEFAVLEKAL